MLQWWFSRVISRLSNLQKSHVFSFIGLMWQIFKTLSISLSLPHLNLSQPKYVFHSNLIFFKLNLYTINSKVCFLRLEIDLGFLNWGFSKKGLGTLFWAKVFQNFEWAMSHLIYVYLCCPLWHFNHVFRHISMCSCIAHMCSVVLHSMCLSKCLSGIFELVGLKWVPILGFTLDWTW